jgi:hypothetical protein
VLLIFVCYLILNSYMSNRHFVVKVNTELTGLTPVNAEVPQGSVLGPLLYLLYTADLPTSPHSFTATFVDDTAVVATDSDPATASEKLQTTFLAIQSSSCPPSLPLLLLAFTFYIIQ